MFCPSCAHDNPEGAARCAACGVYLPSAAGAQQPYYPAPPPQQGYYGMPPPPMFVQKRTSGMAIAGFVCSLVTCGVLGLIFSIIGYNECKRSNGMIEGQGLALAGIIISIVSLAIVLIYFIVIAGFVASRGY
jgi:hypothetical protein